MMNVNTMLSLLGVRLNDVNATRFSSSDKLSVLNSVQDDIASVAHTELLNGCQDHTDFTARATGSSLPNGYFRYVNSKLRAINPVKFITKIDIEKADTEGNRYLKGTNASPTCHIWNNLYYLNVETFTGNYIKVRLYYIKSPTTLVSGGDCDLDARLHPTMIDIADGTIRLNAKVGDPNYAAALIENGYKKIQALSAQVEQSG